jgi:RNase P subunit RPR2
MSYAALPFQRVTYTCRECGAQQRIPLRRIHFFERFHELEGGEVLLIRCPACEEGLQIPSPYRTRRGNKVEVNPEQPPDNAVIHAHY